MLAEVISLWHACRAEMLQVKSADHWLHYQTVLRGHGKVATC